jgi:lysyl-tRNA synthetase class 2
MSAEVVVEQKSVEAVAPVATVQVKVTEKQKALARKEGAKKGQDLSGLQDLGGVSFFHVVLENCDGNWELVEEAMSGANAEVDPNAEERKGGSANIGKVFLSASEDRLCIYLYVPEAVSDKVSVQEWFDVLVKTSGATVLQAAPTDKSFGVAKAEVLHVPEVFPLKVRDVTSSLGYQFLRTKGVIPDEDTSDELTNMDEMNNLEW